jgi:hypothetical protein
VTTTKKWISGRSQALPRTGTDPPSALDLPGKRRALTTLDVRTTGGQTYSSLCHSLFVPQQNSFVWMDTRNRLRNSLVSTSLILWWDMTTTVGIRRQNVSCQNNVWHKRSGRSSSSQDPFQFTRDCLHENGPPSYALPPHRTLVYALPTSTSYRHMDHN